MPMHMLTDAFLRTCSPGEYCDGAGLYFLRQSESSASWYLRYQINGRRRKMGLGSYPEITLSAARQLAAKWRTVKAQRRDPIIERLDEIRRQEEQCPTLGIVAQHAFDAKKPTLKNDGKAGQWFDPLRLHVIPKLGHITPRDLTVGAIVDTFRPIWRDKAVTAMKAINRLDYVIRYASASDDAVDITMVARAKTRLGGQGHKIQHLPALDWQKVPAVYRALGHSVAHTALRFYVLTVVRVSNVTNAEWSEFTKEIWTLPDSRMKAGREFRVPLSWQASGLLSEARSRFKGDRYVFPSRAAWKKGVISENTWNSWLSENGFDCTAHGFRSSFRDWVAENEVCSNDLAEMCVDHTVKSKTEASYFRSDLLEQRAKVMQQWAEFVTGLTSDDRAEIWETKTLIAFEKQQREGKVPSHIDWRDVVEDRSDDG